MAWLNSSVSTGKCPIRLTEPAQRKLSESGQDMEDSGVHLEESPTNFGFVSKVIMTYPPCTQGVSSSLPPSSEWSAVTIIRSTDTRLCEEVDDDDAEVQCDSHDSLCRDLVSQSSKPRVTMTSLTVGYRGDCVTTVGCHEDGVATVQRRVESKSSSTSLTPPRLKQSLSASEGVNFFTGSEVSVGTKAEERRREDVSLSAPEAMAIRDCKDRIVGGQGGGQGGMTKLQKFFEPLRRSRSTGNTKDETRKEEPHQVSGFGSYFFKSSSRKEDRLSADTGNGSMESELDHDSEDPNRTDRSKARNLSTEVKERFSIFLRQHSDSTAPFKEGGRREKLTLEAVLSWAKSFENLLADKNGLHWFREFLKSEFSEENIEFWIACEEYKHLKPQKMAAQAQKIFTQFVTQQAPREINIDSRTRDLTYENVRHPEASTFEAAQKRIESLMGKDSYPRFIESDLYLHLLSGLKS